MNKFSVFILSLSCFSATVFAQINGIVLDSESHSPVEFATIAYQGFMKGTITNQKGQFILEKTDNKNDTLVVSHLNYEPYKLSLAELSGKDTVKILMKKAMHKVEEVTVVAKKIPNILLQAIDHSKQNLPHNFMAQTYLREFVKENEDYTKFSDGLLYFYVADLDDKPKKISVQVKESRAAEIANDDDDSNFDVISPLDIRKVFVLANPGYLNKIVTDQDFYDFSIEQQTSATGQQMQIISFVPKENVHDPSHQYKGEVVIDHDNDLIQECKITLINQQYQETKNLLIFKGKVNNRTYWIKYTNVGKNYFPAFVSLHIGLHIWNNKSIDSNFDFKSDCLISEVVSVGKNPIPGSDNYKKKSLFKLGNNYSEPFWENRGTFSLTKEEKKIIKNIAGKK
jgi:hypothetical protein